MRKRKTAGVAAKKPKATLFKPVKVGWVEFFKGLGKVAGGLIANRPDGATSGLVDSLCAFSVTTDPGELAYRLIHRSLGQALVELVEETRTRFEAIEGREPDALSEALEADLDKLEFAVDRALIKRPESFAGLVKMQPVLGLWLEWQGLKPVEAAAVTRRLPTYFVYALREEWRRDLTGYKLLLEHLEVPFEKAAERDWAWQRYAAQLQRDTEEGVFDEPFSLRQIYVPLISYYLVESPKSRSGKTSERMLRGEGPRRRNIVDLREELDRWRAAYRSDDPMRVLSGGPGCGKSSFVRLLAADWATEGERVLYIPLHVIKPRRDIVEQVGDCMEPVLGYNPLDARDGDTRLVIIFDGLDELANEGKVGAENARVFVNELRRVLGQADFQKHEVRAILCGREPVVQEIDLEGRRDAEVLNLLPYFIPEQERDEGWHDPAKLLRRDRRQEWWRNYAELTGHDWEGLPKDLAREELDEITPQPLLNYLLALSYTRDEVDFTNPGLNRNEIYFDLMKRVHERGWERRRQYAAIAGLAFDDFLRVLEEVALATWHGDSRSTTVRRIEEYCERAGLAEMLENVKRGDELGVMNLLSAFFFRRQGRDEGGTRTFVFTHKSFGEYLTARRVVSQMEATADNRRLRRERRSVGWDETTALAEWAQVCGPNPVTAELLPFIRDEVQLRHIDAVTTWQDDLSELFRHQLLHGIPMEKITRSTFRENWVWSRNASEALLVAVNACARKTERLAMICVGESALGTWLRQIHQQRTSGDNPGSLMSLSFTDLSSQFLYGQDFYGADLSRSNLTNCMLHAAWLTEACLESCRLVGTFFHSSILDNASLANSDCRGARFTRAKVEGTNFDGAILVGTHIDSVIGEAAEGLKREWKKQNSAKAKSSAKRGSSTV